MRMRKGSELVKSCKFSFPAFNVDFYKQITKKKKNNKKCYFLLMEYYENATGNNFEQLKVRENRRNKF